MIGAELDLAVAKAIGGYIQVGMKAGDKPMINFGNCTKPMIPRDEWKPSIDWLQGGPLIEKYGIALTRHEYRKGELCEPYWLGFWANPWDSIHNRNYVEGPTPLIAAMRALVKSKGESNEPK